MVKNKKAEMMYEQYVEGFSLAEVGKMFGVTRQSVYTMFKCRELELRKKKVLPLQFFNQEKFTIMNTGYYRSTFKERNLMHRYVWEFYNGKIKDGYDIHHIDGDKTNNKIENLECMKKEEHSSKYGKKQNQYTKNKL